MSHTIHRRRGAVIVPVLVCFVLIMLICAALVQLVFVERGVTRQDERRLQAEWLAEAGLERAAAKLSRNRGYAGETWDIPASALGGRDAGRVTIAVESSKDKPAQRSVTVQADYPLAPERRARQRRRLTIARGAEPTKGDAP